MIKALLSRQEDLRLVKNDLLQLILTSPGERVHRPNFGTEIRNSLFDPSDDSTYDLLADDILNEITNSEPRVFNTKVFVQAVDDGQVIKVKIKIKGFIKNSLLDWDGKIVSTLYEQVLQTEYM